MDISLLKENFNKNGFAFTYLEGIDDLFPYLKENMKKGSTCAVGGSMTLVDNKVIEFLRSNYEFIDRYEKGLSKEEIHEVFLQSMNVDYYLSSSNAVILDGSIYNVDGNGNRIAALAFGPKKVFVIVGKNKLVNNFDDAVKRVENIAAPLNAKRLNVKTPCVTTGKCQNCNSTERICLEYQHIKKQKNNRIEIILINENLGY